MRRYRSHIHVVNTYQAWREFILAGRNPPSLGRPIAKATHARLFPDQDGRPGSVAIRYHRTHIVSYQAGGDIELDNSGYWSDTTWRRMCEYSPLRIQQELPRSSRQWWLARGRTRYLLSFPCCVPADPKLQPFNARTGCFLTTQAEYRRELQREQTEARRILRRDRNRKRRSLQLVSRLAALAPTLPEDRPAWMSRLATKLYPSDRHHLVRQLCEDMIVPEAAEVLPHLLESLQRRCLEADRRLLWESLRDVLEDILRDPAATPGPRPRQPLALLEAEPAPRVRERVIQLDPRPPLPSLEPADERF